MLPPPPLVLSRRAIESLRLPPVLAPVTAFAPESPEPPPPRVAAEASAFPGGPLPTADVPAVPEPALPLTPAVVFEEEEA